MLLFIQRCVFESLIRFWDLNLFQHLQHLKTCWNKTMDLWTLQKNNQSPMTHMPIFWWLQHIPDNIFSEWEMMFSDNVYKQIIYRVSYDYGIYKNIINILCSSYNWVRSQTMLLSNNGTYKNASIHGIYKPTKITGGPTLYPPIKNQQSTSIIHIPYLNSNSSSNK